VNGRIAVPADCITDKNPRHHPRILSWAFALSARAPGPARVDVAYSVFCFADSTRAERFCERFGGDRFDPQDYGRGSAWFLSRKS
jgi:hypothetical protein